ncbi:MULTISPECIES: hypothetical protein [Persicobacter]|uniref:Uncharacterized protein n=1 Tax=Persicobacter diffluens TaxID=981 RepID=A0AAN5AJ65_9BACT|nr:hypothetical protein [Persicobacter sp. CCB-QB2]GJM60624.1 hypothetical protein PEDI_11760 [Persicobacter diffluens]
MAKKSSNIVNRYFINEFGAYKVLVQVNPVTLEGLELIVHPDNRIEKTEMEFDEEIYDDLAEDKFEETNGLAFNLYLSQSEGELPAGEGE